MENMMKKLKAAKAEEEPGEPVETFKLKGAYDFLENGLKQALGTGDKYWRIPNDVSYEYIPNFYMEKRRINFIRDMKWQHLRNTYPISGISESFYMLAILLSMIIASFYIALSTTLMGWKQSLKSVTPNVTKPELTRHYTMFEHGDFGGYNIDFGIYFYIVIASWIIVSNITGLYFAGVLGMKKWYKLVVIFNGVCWCIEASALLITSLQIPSHCDISIFKEHFTTLFKWYGIYIFHEDNIGHEATEKIDAIQQALGCCGIDGWTDYEQLFITSDQPGWSEEHKKKWWPTEREKGIQRGKFYESETEVNYYKEGRHLREIPHSCCKTDWAQNIFCARNLKQLDEQIYPELRTAAHRAYKRGCIPLLESHCNQLISFLTTKNLYLILFRLLLIFLYVFLAKYVQKQYGKTIARNLFILTESEVGRNYLPFVKGPDDVNLSLNRFKLDRFDPNIFKWVTPSCTKIMAPKTVEKEGIPEGVFYRIEQGLLDDLEEKAEDAGGVGLYQEIYDDFSYEIQQRRRQRLIDMQEFDVTMKKHLPEERNLYDEFDLATIQPEDAELDTWEKLLVFEQRNLIQNLEDDEKIEEANKNLRMQTRTAIKEKKKKEVTPQLSHFNVHYILDESKKSFKRRLLISQSLGPGYNPFVDANIKKTRDKLRKRPKKSKHHHHHHHKSHEEVQSGEEQPVKRESSSSSSTLSYDPLVDYPREFGDLPQPLKPRISRPRVHVHHIPHVHIHKKKKILSKPRGAPRVAYMTTPFAQQQVKTPVDEKLRKGEVRRLTTIQFKEVNEVREIPRRSRKQEKPKSPKKLNMKPMQQEISGGDTTPKFYSRRKLSH